MVSASWTLHYEMIQIKNQRQLMFNLSNKTLPQRERERETLPCFNVTAFGPLGETALSPRNMTELLVCIFLFFRLPNNFEVNLISLSLPIGNLISKPFIFSWLSIFFQIYILLEMHANKRQNTIKSNYIV